MCFSTRYSWTVFGNSRTRTLLGHDDVRPDRGIAGRRRAKQTPFRSVSRSNSTTPLLYIRKMNISKFVKTLN